MQITAVVSHKKKSTHPTFSAVRSAESLSNNNKLGPYLYTETHLCQTKPKVKNLFLANAKRL